MYAKDISKKVKSVKHDRARQGLFMSVSAPYGYQKAKDNKNKLVIDDNVSWIVKRIFDMALSGMPCRKIAETL